MPPSEFTPHQEVAADECMIPFHGRLSFKQYHMDQVGYEGLDAG